MRVIDINGKKVSLEFDWNTLDAEVARAKAIKQLLSEPENKAYKKGILLEYEGQTVIGFTDSKDKSPSAAAWLALANQAKNRQQEAEAQSQAGGSGRGGSGRGGSGRTGGKKKFSFSFKKPASKPLTESGGDHEHSSGSSTFTKANWIVIENLGVLNPNNSASSSAHASSSTPSGSATTPVTASDSQKPNSNPVSSGAFSSDNVNLTGQETFWFAVIQDGLPLPGADLLMTWDEIVEHLNAMVSGASNLYTIYTKDPRVQSLFEARVTLVNKGFSELVSDTKYKSKLRTLQGIPPEVYMVIAVIVVLFILYFAYSNWQTHRRDELARLAASKAASAQGKAAQIAKQNYVKTVHDKVMADFKDGLQSINSSLNQGDPDTMVVAWNNLLARIPISNAGWQLQNVSCGLDSTLPECQVRLSRGSYGINSNLIDVFPHAQLSGDGAYYVLTGSAITPRKNDMHNIVGGRTLALGLLSQLQLLRLSGLQYTISPSSEIEKAVTLPPPPAGLPEAVAKKLPGHPQIAKKDKPVNYQIKYGVAYGTLDVSGKHLWEVSGMASILNSPALVVKSLSLNPNTDATDASWTISLVYFIRTAPYPTLPSIPSADFKGGQYDPATQKMVTATTSSPTAPNSPAHPLPDFSANGIHGSHGSAVAPHNSVAPDDIQNLSPTDKVELPSSQATPNPAQPSFFQSGATPSFTPTQPPNDSPPPPSSSSHP